MIDPHAVDKPPAVYGMAPSVADQYAAAGVGPLSGWPYINVMGEHACVQRVKFRLENRQIKVLECCVNTIREFRSWRYKTNRDGKPLATDEYEDSNNHALDCLKGFFAANPTFTPQRIEVCRSTG
jgi:hypothetical protein